MLLVVGNTHEVQSGYAAIKGLCEYWVIGRAGGNKYARVAMVDLGIINKVLMYSINNDNGRQ